MAHAGCRPRAYRKEACERSHSHPVHSRRRVALLVPEPLPAAHLTPLVQIVLGLIASQMPFFPDVQLDPELFLVLFIAPLLYLEAHEINKSQLLKSLKLSLSLAIGLAIFTMVVVGFSLHTLWPMFPLAAALALGAALGPTDAVAVSSLSHEATLTQRQIGVLKGESLFNDARHRRLPVRDRGGRQWRVYSGRFGRTVRVLILRRRHFRLGSRHGCRPVI